MIFLSYVFSRPFAAMKFLQHCWFLFVLRIIVGGVFLYAGILKMGNPQAFADSIASFRMLPAEGIGVLALALPPFEIFAGLLLITGWQLRSAAFSVAALCAVFALALVQALVRRLQVDCGCFGSGEPSAFKTGMSLGRDLLLLTGSQWLYIAQAKKITKSGV